MKNYQPILAAIDYSKFSNEVLKNALSLARQLAAGIKFVNIINQKDIDIVKYTVDRMSIYTYKLSITDYIAGLRDECQVEMEKFFLSVDLESLEI